METSTPFLPSTNSTLTATVREDYSGDDTSLRIYSIVQILSIVSYTVTFVLGTVGNGLVIWTALYRMKRTVNMIWFLNLSLADLGFDIFLPLMITESIMEGHWPFGWIMCKITQAADMGNMAVSTSFLMLISVDRCISVLYPVWSRNHRTPRLATIISIVTWLLCIIFHSPYLIFAGLVFNIQENASYCDLLPSVEYGNYRLSYKVMILSTTILMFLIQFFVILLCYCLTTIRHRRSRCFPGSKETSGVITSIVLSFFFCWFPYHFYNFLLILGIEINLFAAIIIFSLLECLALFSSCLNPILHVFVGRDFKKGLMKSVPIGLESILGEWGDLKREHGYKHPVRGNEVGTSSE